MTALAANTEILCKNVTKHRRFLMAASTTIYKGALCMINANGLLAAATPTASTQFAGVAAEGVVSAASGSYYCNVIRDGSHLLTTSGMAQANVGDLMYAADSGTVGATATNAHKVGIIDEFVSATQVWVDISEAVLNPVLGS